MDVISHLGGIVVILFVLYVAICRIREVYSMIGYRFLILDEKILSTDECWMGGKWQSVPYILVGLHITSESNDVYRRRV